MKVNPEWIKYEVKERKKNRRKNLGWKIPAFLHRKKKSHFSWVRLFKYIFRKWEW